MKIFIRPPRREHTLLV